MSAVFIVGLLWFSYRVSGGQLACPQIQVFKLSKKTITSYTMNASIVLSVLLLSLFGGLSSQLPVRPSTFCYYIYVVLLLPLKTHLLNTQYLSNSGRV